MLRATSSKLLVTKNDENRRYNWPPFRMRIGYTQLFAVRVSEAEAARNKTTLITIRAIVTGVCAEAREASGARSIADYR